MAAGGGSGAGRAGRAPPRDGAVWRRRGGARAAAGGVTLSGGGRAAWGRGAAGMEGVLYKWTNYLSGEFMPVLSLCGTGAVISHGCV